jgi:hypothetical protein
LKYNQFANCNVTPEDAKRALAIYGPDVSTLKGKTTKHKGAHIPSFQRVNIPAPILEHHRNITIGIDFMYINSNPFFHSISRNLQFCTIASMTSRLKNTMLQEVNVVIKLYTNRDFNVVDINADKEFECIYNDLLLIWLHIVDKDSHVAEVERPIRVVKERVQITETNILSRLVAPVSLNIKFENDQIHKTFIWHYCSTSGLPI